MVKSDAKKPETPCGISRYYLLSSVVAVSLCLANLAYPTDAGPEVLAGGLPPALRWLCSGREHPQNRFHFSFRDIILDGQYATSRVCQRFRGGQLSQNETVDSRDSTETDTTATLVAEKKEPIDYKKSPFSFTVYQENDGSKEDPDGIPNRYLKMQNDKRENAKRAFHSTLQWREENDIDTILARPHSKFDVCKRVFPHYFCGRDDTNHVILLQRPGLIDLTIAQANSLTGDDLLYHYVYEMEYLWQVLEPDPNGTMTSIIDLTGLNLSILRKRELLSVVQKFCSTMDAHFPQRSHKTLLINSPKWFGAIYKIISPLLRESTKAKIFILTKGKAQDETLQELMSDCPIETSDNLEEVPPAQMEEDLRNFCLARLEESGEQMQPVIT